MFKEILHFIKENYEVIILVGACLLDLVLFLVGVLKKKKTTPLGQVVQVLPIMIRKAEEKLGSGNGALKKQFVMDAALNFYQRLTGVALTDDSCLADEISHAIEEILSTPTKKGK